MMSATAKPAGRGGSGRARQPGASPEATTAARYGSGGASRAAHEGAARRLLRRPARRAAAAPPQRRGESSRVKRARQGMPGHARARQGHGSVLHRNDRARRGVAAPTPAGPVLQAQVEGSGCLGGGPAVDLDQQGWQGARWRGKVLQAAATATAGARLSRAQGRGSQGNTSGVLVGGKGEATRAPDGLSCAPESPAAWRTGQADNNPDGTSGCHPHSHPHPQRQPPTPCLVARPVEVHVGGEAALGLKLHHRGLRQVARVHLGGQGHM